MTAYTEDEASNSRCCGPKGCGREDPFRGDERFCIASACMAWRGERTDRIAKDKDGYEFIQENVPTGLGYCGLAGKP